MPELLESHDDPFDTVRLASEWDVSHAKNDWSEFSLPVRFFLLSAARILEGR